MKIRGTITGTTLGVVKLDLDIELPELRTAWNPAGLPAYDVPPVPLDEAIDEAMDEEDP